MQEFIHELKPNWVLVGSLGGGGAVLGALRMSMPVIGIGKNERHTTLVREWLVHKMANDLCTHTPLADPSMLARAAALKPTKTPC